MLASSVQCPLLWGRGANSLTKQFAVDDEQLDRQHADVGERIGDGERQADRPIGERRVDLGGHDRQVENAVDMPILRHRPRRCPAVSRPRHDHAQLGLEVEE